MKHHNKTHQLLHHHRHCHIAATATTMQQQQKPTTRTIILLALVALVAASQVQASPKQTTKITHHENKPSASDTLKQRQDLPASASSSLIRDSKTPIADKKQGDAPFSSSAAASSASVFDGAEEYVQVKPEEVVAGATSKEASRQSMAAEHKAAEEELLNVQLAQDTINQQESMQHGAYSAPQQYSAPRSEPREGSAYRPAAGGPVNRPPPPMRAARNSPRGYPSAGPQAVLPPAQVHPPMPRPAAYGPGAPSGPRMPPSYITLKGKLTGINSLISQYPHPAPGYPHHGPRHLPRGAAAGYAAFRDFVRAHASKYKHVGPPMPLPPSSSYPVQQSAGPPAPSGGAYPASPPAAAAAAHEASSYGPSAAAPAKEYPVVPYQQSQAAPSGPRPYGSGGKTRVTLAQAYIPHLTAAAKQQSGYGQEAGQYGTAAVGNYMSKLYGGHMPQGNGKPEYNKDFGMVIHYPQATVYTEPMSVDQLHKLAGNGISQVIQELQHNLANGGHRDESNTLRSSNKPHHLGHGVTIHAKEYYAPSKSGHYVPTTAAVIQTAAKPATSGYEAGQSLAEQAASGYPAPQGQEYATQAQAAAYGGSDHSAGHLQDGAAGSYGGKPELGSGYERVRQAAAASQEPAKHYGMPETSKYPAPEANYQQPQQQQQSAQQQVASAYEQSQQQQAYGAGGKQQAAGAYQQPSSNGEPLSAVTNFLGSELESLYKANADLNKHLDHPEIQDQIQAYAKSSANKGPLKYHDLHASRPQGYNSGRQQRYPQQQQHSRHPAPSHYNGPAGPRGPRGYPPRGRPNRHQPMRPHEPPHAQHQGYRMNNGHQQQQQHYNGPQPQYQQQSAGSYGQQNSADLSYQMMQLLQDFRTGDEQYNTKPPTKINQGYPHKALQKQQQHQQQQQQYGYGQQQSNAAAAYHQHDGVEIPQGPNDQIGEIHELIEALKGSLESHGKPEQHQEAQTPPPSYHQQQQQQQQPETGAYGHQQQHQHQQQGGQADVSYLTSALGQAPSYALQVPVANGDQYGQQQQHQQSAAAYAPAAPAPAAPAAAYQGTKGGAPEAAYQQQQQSAGYGQHQQETGAGYGQAVAQAASLAAYEKAAKQQPAADAYQQLMSPAPAAPAAPAPVSSYSAPAGGYEAPAQQYGHQQQAGAGAYGAQQAPAPAQQSHYAQGHQQAAQQQEYQQQQQQIGSTAYSSPPAHDVISGTYPQQQQQHQHHQQQHHQQQHHNQQAAVSSVGDEQQQQQYSQQPASSGYTSSEHQQVINHLVPAVQALHQASPSAVAGAYETQAGGHSAAGEGSQYQQQSLSSFVDSLAAEYQQELLRHPSVASSAALLDGAQAAGLASQLASYSNQQQHVESQQQHQQELHYPQASNQQATYQRHPAKSASSPASSPSASSSSSAQSSNSSSGSSAQPSSASSSSSSAAAASSAKSSASSSSSAAAAAAASSSSAASSSAAASKSA